MINFVHGGEGAEEYGKSWRENLLSWVVGWPGRVLYNIDTILACFINPHSSEKKEHHPSFVIGFHVRSPTTCRPHPPHWLKKFLFNSQDSSLGPIKTESLNNTQTVITSKMMEWRPVAPAGCGRAISEVCTFPFASIARTNTICFPALGATQS